jgi:beta-lactamase regulating signal transducer with metallopeptidase domain
VTRLDLVAAPLIGALGSAALKAGVILILAEMATRCLRRRSAALKHLVWTSGLGATIAVLVLPAVVPAWRIIPVPTLSFGVSTSGGTAASPTAAALAAPPSRADGLPLAQPSRQPSDAPQRRIAPSEFSAVTVRHWPSALLGCWVIGVVVILTRYGWSSAALHRLSRRATALRATPCGALGQHIAGEMRIARPVRLLSSEDVELPLAWGVFRPAVVLPGDVSEWTLERCRYVLQHELAHVRRLDACTQLVAHAASGIFWFHPLVWHACRQMRYARERACDDCVLARGALASEYASNLLALVGIHGHVDRHPVALAMARRAEFEGRLLALLDPTIERDALSPRRLALVLGLGLGLVVPAAAARGAHVAAVAPPIPVAIDAPVTPAPGIRLKPPPTAAPEIRPRPRPLAASVEDLFAGCASTASIHDHDNADMEGGRTTWRVSAQEGDCSFDLTAAGHVEFNRDATALASISAGDSIEVTTVVHGDITRLVARGSPNGVVNYEFSRNGQQVEFVATGKPWLEQFLLVLDRHTAFAIDRRFLLLLQAGGPMNVLDEIDRMPVDHAKTVYLRRLLDATRLDAVALCRTADAAAAMSSDHEIVDVFVTAAQRYELPPLALHTMLSAVSKVRAEYGKVRILLALARTQRLVGTLRDEYLNASATITLDRERGRTIAAIDRH